MKVLRDITIIGGIIAWSILYWRNQGTIMIEQACISGYEWVVLVDAKGQGVALEQVFRASEVPGAPAQPVECEDL